MAVPQTIGIDQVSARIEAMLDLPDQALAAAALERADELLALGEAVLEAWLIAHGAKPTESKSESFRLLALHRQGARGDPSFNACRESCRELVYHHNLVRLEPAHSDVALRLRLGAMVARHLALFIGGKLELAGLGEFCCSSRPLRARQGEATPNTARTT
jgi:hypothetical protein